MGGLDKVLRGLRGLRGLRAIGLLWSAYLLACRFPAGTAQLSDNSPPVLHLQRDWRISENETIGSVVARVDASDAEQSRDELRFGLEPLPPLPIAYNGTLGQSLPLPFQIDEVSGVVTTNASLKDRGGKPIRLYVTVFDGTSVTKLEVSAWVLTSKSTGSPKPLPRPPSFSPPFPFQNRPFQPFPTNILTPGVPVVNPGPPPGAASQPSVLWSAVPPRTPSRPSPTRQPGISSSPTQPALSEDATPTADDAVAATSLVDQYLWYGLAAALVALAVAVALLLCRRYRAKRPAKASKEDLHKEASGLSSAQSSALSSSGLSADGPCSVLMHLKRPRAVSNRYRGWKRDGSAGGGGGPAHPPLPIKSGDRWEFPRHHLNVRDILGEGCFGQVWRAEATDIDGKEGKTIVAVKMLKENAGEKERVDLQQELAVMKTLEPHPNVVRLLGCCTGGNDPLLVIMEFVALGKLQSLLRSSRAERDYGNLHGPSRTLTSRDLTCFLYQVAKGMEFLSSRGIIHRDLAARNVLVGEDRICKVADFGFARDLMDNHVYERKSEGRLPIRWMAPESLYDNEFSVKSDVWSYGILMWEVVTLGSTPYPGMGAAEVMRQVRSGYRLDKPEHCRRELYNIMYYCWDRVASERPNFTELAQRTEELLVTETDYIELERFPDHSYYNMASLSGEKL